MSQNNMVNFITLTQIHDSINKIELNPAFILYMIRGKYGEEDGYEAPFTKLYTSNGHCFFVTETPEQIAQLQIDAVHKTMKSVLQATTQLFEQLEEEL